MRQAYFHYFPLAWPFLLIFFGLLLVALLYLQFWVIRDAYEKMGIRRGSVFGLLLLSLLGSYVNLPIAELPGEPVETGVIVEFAGMRYIVPVKESPGTMIAINLGGAIIPAFLSAYLAIKNRLFLQSILGILVVAVIVHWLAKPVHGVGITVPFFVPPLAAALIALIVSWSHAPALAYISGSIGTLLGADVLNLDKIQGLGAPVASIGGAGTFDSIFVTGILAVLLVSIGRPTQNPPEDRRQPDFHPL